MEIQHLSPSTCQSYKTCGKAVYLQKIEGIKNNTGYSKTAFGSAQHSANEYLFTQKMNGNDITLEEYKLSFLDSYDYYSKYTNIWSAGDTKEHLIEQGLIACDTFYKYWRGKFNPIAVEKEFNIDRGEGKLPIKTIADLITSDGQIIDWKYGAMAVAHAGNYILNMSTYAWCYQLEYGELPREVALVACNWKRKKVNDRFMYFVDGFRKVSMNVTQKWIDYAKTVYDDVEAGIKANVFLTASDNNGLCKECWYRKTGDCNVVIME